MARSDWLVYRAGLRVGFREWLLNLSGLCVVFREWLFSRASVLLGSGI